MYLLHYCYRMIIISAISRHLYYYFHHLYYYFHHLNYWYFFLLIVYDLICFSCRFMITKTININTTCLSHCLIYSYLLLTTFCFIYYSNNSLLFYRIISLFYHFSHLISHHYDALTTKSSISIAISPLKIMSIPQPYLLALTPLISFSTLPPSPPNHPTHSSQIHHHVSSKYYYLLFPYVQNFPSSCFH